MKFLLATLCFAGALGLQAQQPASSPAAPANPPVSQTPTVPPAKSVQLGLEDPSLRDALTKWLTRSPAPATPTVVELKPLTPGLEKALTEHVQKSARTTFWDVVNQNSTVIAALLSALLTGGLSFWGILVNSRRQLERERTLQEARAQSDQLLQQERAGFDRALQQERARSEEALESTRARLIVAEAVRKIRVARLQKFYAPLSALMQQSRGVSNKLFLRIYDTRTDPRWQDWELKMQRLTPAHALAAPADGTPPTTAEAQASTSDHQRVSIRRRVRPAGEPPDAGWKILRTLDFLPIIKRDPPSDQLVKLIISIGQQAAGVISKHGGLAATGQEHSPLYGEYMAHFAVLDDMYKNCPSEPYEPESQQVGYFPIGFDRIIEADYKKARTDVAQYEGPSAHAESVESPSDHASTPNTTV